MIMVHTAVNTLKPEQKGHVGVPDTFEYVSRIKQKFYSLKFHAEIYHSGPN